MNIHPTEALSPEQKASVVARYKAGESSLQLAAAFGTTKPTILKAIRQSGTPRRSSDIARRRHPIDDTVFDTVTENSAYWIGFLMADGCVSGTRFALGLSKSDLPHIIRFREFLKSGHAISERPAGPMIHLPKKGKVYTCKAVCTLLISCKKLTEALRRYGLHPNKSYGAKVIGLEHDRHFWRGLIDGDGSVYIGRFRDGKEHPRVGLTGSRPLLQQFVTFARSQGILSQATIHQGNGKCFSVAFSGPAALALIRLLYGNCQVALPRKLKTASEILTRWPLS